MTSASYADRRRRAQSVLAGSGPDATEGGTGVLLVPSAPLTYRNNDVENEYRQDSDLYYLTGFEEPYSALVLEPDRTTLFVQPRSPDREAWDGRRAGVAGAVARHGADEAHTIETLSAKLPDLLEGHTRLYYRLGIHRTTDDLVLAAIDRARVKGRQGKTWPTHVVDPSVLVHEMRVIKDASEVELMQRAADITAEAHAAVMREVRPGIHEYELEAILRAKFRQRGAERTAYSPIVGSGPNATVLHHRLNDRHIEEGDLVLVDAGCELGYYASDVTRTFPASGRFSGPQRSIYDIVLEAQVAAIEATAPGKTLDEVHSVSVDRITRGLVDLGLVEGPADAAIEAQRYKPYFMHKTSHYLGMDVHDVGAYFVDGKPRALEPGMVVTIEPGVYVAVDSQAPDEYRGIGVRIEDDVLVTEDGCRVLTESIPKTADDVERACEA